MLGRFHRLGIDVGIGSNMPRFSLQEVFVRFSFGACRLLNVLLNSPMLSGMLRMLSMELRTQPFDSWLWCRRVEEGCVTKPE